MNNVINNETIELYLNGDLHGNDLQQFETQLGSNPELQQEVNFQKEVGEQISEFKRLEMKSRLSNIPVSGGGLSTIQKGLLIAASSITALIGGAYMYSTLSNKPDVIVEQKELISPKLSEESPSNIIEEPQVIQEELSVATEETPTAAQPTEAMPIEQPPAQKTTTLAPTNPFDAISMEMEEDNLGNEGIGTSETRFASNVSISKARNINVKPQDGGSKLKYRYDGNELVLIGKKFKEHEETFMLLMDDKSNHLYLSFEGDYYEIINHHNKETYRLEPLSSMDDINKLKEAE